MSEARVSLVAQDTEARVRCCVDGRWSHRLLTRFTACGLHVWCPLCRGEHLVSWAQMEQLRHWLGKEPGEGRTCDF